MFNMKDLRAKRYGGAPNPASRVDCITNPSVVIVIRNLAPSAVTNIAGPAEPGLPSSKRGESLPTQFSSFVHRTDRAVQLYGNPPAGGRLRDIIGKWTRSKVRVAMLSIWLSVLVLGPLTISDFCLAEENRTTIGKSLIPAEANDISAFVPKGWRIEQQLKDDLNGDGVPDYVLELIEDKPSKDKNNDPVDRARALVIVFQLQNGRLSRATVADKLLQCTQCGGSFYGPNDAPAEVKIEKGVIIITQDSGSNEVTEETYRFRYDPTIQKLVLIGFDLNYRNRATGAVVSESTNYLTGARRTERGDINRTRNTTTHIRPAKIPIEEIDDQTFEQEAFKRLNLN
jgi:hypothetical protein